MRDVLFGLCLLLADYLSVPTQAAQLSTKTADADIRPSNTGKRNERIAQGVNAPVHLPRFGSRFPSNTLEVDGTPGNLDEVLRGHWTFIVVRSSLDAGSVEYPRALLRRVNDDRLQVLFLLRDTPENRAEAKAMDKTRGLRVGFDLHSALARRFRLPSQAYVATFLVDPGGITKFALPHPAIMKPEAMRNLVERYLATSPPPLGSDMRGYQSGASLPSAPIFRVADSSQQTELTELPADGTVLFFRAACASCRHPQIIEQLDYLTRSGFDFRAERVFPLFSSYFSTAQIVDSTKSIMSSVPIYRAKEYILDWEEPYFSDLPEQSEAIAVRYHLDYARG
jgi:hypothetical protein